MTFAPTIDVAIGLVKGSELHGNRLCSEDFDWGKCNQLILLIDKVPWLIDGEGVQTELSLPNVEKTIGSVSELTDDEAKDLLQDAIQETFVVFGDIIKRLIFFWLRLLYELFSFKHCKGRRVKLALCEGTHAHSRSTLEVPVFYFIHGEPLFVDKHYQAKHLGKASPIMHCFFFLPPPYIGGQ
ncbi:uncharacterized protein LOC133798520 isoform X1 [Humulus lupulus]|uniref:uncharacterized protein LOC133798520 isoform X1 n=1 Tax=Humulus lupulus TaxID=3486 RepID=UPI002B40DB57|nr:uncharacterized protein LOC133798520 isoform X1 [Humulus lupulus]